MRAHQTSKIAAALFCAGLVLGVPAFAARQTVAPKTTTTPSTATPSTTKKVPAKRVVKKRAPRQRVQTAPTPARISEIQSALAAQGVYKAQPNGRWDSATIQAMKDFQGSHGLSATGKLDAPTLQKLGLGSEIAGRAAPLPPPQTPTANTSAGQQQTP